MARNSWLLCSVSAGMLPNEVAVSIDTVAGPVSLFAENSLVRNAPAGGSALAVTIIDEDAKYSLVRLPTMPLESSPVVKVEKTHLVQLAS